MAEKALKIVNEILIERGLFTTQDWCSGLFHTACSANYRTELSKGCNGVAFSNDGGWPMTGAHFDETVASKPPVDPSLPAAATEQADRKSLRPESLHCRIKFRSIAGTGIFAKSCSFAIFQKTLCLISVLTNRDYSSINWVDHPHLRSSRV